jgi:Cyclin
MFQSEKKPQMSIQAYVTRFVLFFLLILFLQILLLFYWCLSNIRLAKLTHMSGEALLLSMIYLNRISSNIANFPINIFTIHRLVLAWYVFVSLIAFVSLIDGFANLVCYVRRNLSMIHRPVMVDLQKWEV